MSIDGIWNLGKSLYFIKAYEERKLINFGHNFGLLQYQGDNVRRYLS